MNVHADKILGEIVFSLNRKSNKIYSVEHLLKAVDKLELSCQKE